MLDIKKELEGKLTSLVVTSDVGSVMDVVGSAAEKYQKICYVSFSRPYYSFLRYFKVNKINPNNFFFIDAITKSVIKNPEKIKDCIFASKPNAFEEITEAIKKVLQERKFDILIFDSLSSVLIYKKEIFVTRFLHNLTAMIKGLDCKSVFIILEKDVDKDIVKNLGMLTNKTLYLI